MKIDLHCQTKKTKKNEPLTRNVEKGLFADKIRKIKTLRRASRRT